MNYYNHCKAQTILSEQGEPIFEKFRNITIPNAVCLFNLKHQCCYCYCPYNMHNGFRAL